MSEPELETDPSRSALSYFSELLALLLLGLVFIAFALFVLWAFFTYTPFWLILIMLAGAGIYGFFAVTNRMAHDVIHGVGDKIEDTFKKK